MGCRLGSFGLFVAACSLLLSGCHQADGRAKGGIVSLAPHLTETVYALGKGHNLVGAGDFCDFPPAVRELPKLGGYVNPDLETLAMLGPDILLLPGKHPKVSEFAAIHRLNVLNVHMDSLATIEAGILEIGQALACEADAVALRDAFSRDVASLRDGLAGVERPSVLIITSRPSHDLSTLNTVGGSSFVSEMVALAGGENVFADIDKPYFEASKEEVVMRAPEVVIEFRPGESFTENQRQQLYNDWRRLETLPAVERARIYFIFDSHGLRPGPRIVEVARHIAGLLHPIEVARL